MKKVAYYISLALLIIICGSVAYGACYYYDKNLEIDKEYLVLTDQKLRLLNELADLEASNTNEIANEEDGEIVEETSVDTSSWITYTNAKYGFSFKYPETYSIGNCTTKPCGEYINEMSDGDQTVMQGDISQVGWPNIVVMHLASDYYNPPAGTDLREWLVTNNSMNSSYISLSPNYMITASDGGNYDAFDFIIPESPQTYSQRYIYFLNNDNKLFVIQLYDYQSYSSKFYESWLGTFVY